MNLPDFILSFVALLAPRSTEDWQAGDLAICVADNWGASLPENPRKDDLLRVAEVCMAGRFLHFQGKPAHYHWLAIAFRKVRPDTDAADDEAWVEQLRHRRPKVGA